MIQAPFIWLALSFTGGILLQPFCPRGWVWPLLLGVPALLFFLKGRKIFNLFLCAGFLVLGVALADLNQNPAVSTLKQEIEKQGTEHFFAITGEVNTEPEIKIQGRKQTASFILNVTQVIRWENRKAVWKRKVQGKAQVFLNQPGKAFEIGDTLRLWGRFENLPPVLNPGGFNYKEYLRARDIDFILSVYGPKSVRVLRAADVSDPRRLLSRLRQAIRGRINALFKDKESLLIRALILGDRKNLKGPILDDFLKTGTTHLLAISGLNISMVAGSLYLILIVLRAGQKKAAFLALILAMLQTAVGGFGIPVQRAGIMGCLGFLALILERERSSLNVFALAFLILLIADTRNLQSISFQLSFLSLFCLIMFTHLWNRKWSYAEAWASSAAVLAGTFPVVVYHFSAFSLMGIVTNVLAVPLFHFVLLTACLSLLFGSIPWLGLIPIKLCSAFLQGALSWIQVCALPDWGYFFIPRPAWIKIFSYYLFLSGLTASFLMLRFKKLSLRIIFFILWAASAASFFMTPSREGFRAVFLSAGSNEIAHLEFGPANHWLINSGRTFPGDQARWILQPYLRSQGIKVLKGIIFSDHLKRHTSGLETLERSFQFQNQIYPAQDKKETQPLSKKAVFLRAGSSIQMPEGGRIEILSHSRGRFIFRVRIQERVLLFLPDISFEVFQRLTESKDRRSDILVLPAMRSPDEALLKSILTLTAAHAVIAPALDKKTQEVLQVKGVTSFALKTKGALELRLEQEGEHKNKFRAESFLLPGKADYI